MTPFEAIGKVERFRDWLELPDGRGIVNESPYLQRRLLQLHIVLDDALRYYPKSPVLHAAFEYVAELLADQVQVIPLDELP